MYIQSKIHAPKDEVNQYGKYKYRKAEQILEAAKPYLAEMQCTLVVSDEIVLVGNSIYVKATSTITNKKGDKESAIGWAREADQLAGMSPGQVTGATSSYARKYSLCGLFAIDDTKDLDDESLTNPQTPKPVAAKAAPKQQRPAVPQQQKGLEEVLKDISEANTKEALANIFNVNAALQSNKDFINALKVRKDQILNGNGTTAA